MEFECISERHSISICLKSEFVHQTCLALQHERQPLYREGFSPENFMANESSLVKDVLLTTDPCSVMKIGPGLVPLIAKYFNSICTGQKTGWRFITKEKGCWL